MKTGAFNVLRSHCLLALLIISLLFTSCSEDYQPKPHGYFRIGLPSDNYSQFSPNCPYAFLKNDDGKWIDKEKCWGDFKYPSIRANIQLTYKPIANQEQLERILKESQDLAYKHSVAAQGIGERLYMNEERGTYGILYQMKGNAASSTQFFVTDSAEHFLRGVVYFYSAPNADSLKPVNDFMYNEMVQLIESLEWKNSLPSQPLTTP